MDETGDVRSNIDKFFDAVDKLNEMDIVINSDLLAIMLLYSLPSRFENFRCAIEFRDELPTLEVLKVKIIEESEARKNEIRAPVQNALTAGKKNHHWHRENKTKQMNNATAQNDKETRSLRCHRCHKMGHKARYCREKPKGENASAKHTEEVSLYAFAGLGEHERGSEQKWCLDSGAMSHLCMNINDFKEIEDSTRSTLNLADKRSTEITAKGTAGFTANVNGKLKNITLKKALFVPELRTNLLSISKITDYGHEVLFRQNEALVISKNGQIQMTADRVGDLYFAREEIKSKDSVFNAVKQLKSTEIWHRRMGHVSKDALVNAVRKGYIIGPKDANTDRDIVCEVCCKGKMTRTPFPKASTRESDLLDIIHTDVCGPMRVESQGGSKYFIEFIDDRSRWCEVRFLRSKSEALEATKEIISLFKKQIRKKVKCIQSDNGTEFVNDKFNEMLKERGIKRRLTVPHNPEQNGISERKNRTLMDTARCLLIESDLPPSFWAEAINAAAYIRNRCPSRTLNGRTPHEIWTGRKPHVSHIRIFGSKSYCLRRDPGRGKLEPRGEEGILVEYSEASKGYRIWLPDKRKVIISRDVKFLENLDQRSKDWDDFAPKNTFELSNDDTKSGDITSEHSTIDILLDEYPQENESLDALDIEIQELQNNEELVEERHEEENEPTEAISKKGSGRPKLLRTGKVGRPRKIYQTVSDRRKDNENEETGMACEIPLTQALKGPDARMA